MWLTRGREPIDQASSTPSALTTANGIRVLPDRVDDDWSEERAASIYPDQSPADALNRTLDRITELYGEATTNVVAMQLEYQR
ncbi:hypothetical protein D3C80_1939580 [compost metagenome]